MPGSAAHSEDEGVITMNAVTTRVISTSLGALFPVVPGAAAVATVVLIC